MLLIFKGMWVVLQSYYEKIWIIVFNKLWGDIFIFIVIPHRKDDTYKILLQNLSK